MQEVTIIGAGGCGREVADIIEAMNVDQPRYTVLGYIVEAKYAIVGKMINDLPVIGDFEWFEKHPQVQTICAAGMPEIRHRLVAKAEKAGAKFFNAIHPSVILSRWITISEGVVIASGTTVTNRVNIGRHVHINNGCTVNHDDSLDDYVTLSPGVHLAGNVVLEKGAYMGIGSIVIQQKTIGRWSIVGAGSTILEDVPPNTTVVGVPGKVIKTRDEGWHLQ